LTVGDLTINGFAEPTPGAGSQYKSPTAPLVFVLVL
jgi:hypothetical protein